MQREDKTLVIAEIERIKESKCMILLLSHAVVTANLS